MEHIPTPSGFAALEALANRAADFKTIPLTKESRNAVAQVPNDAQLVDLRKYNFNPQHVRFEDVQSLVKYIERHKVENQTIMLVNSDSSTLTVEFDHTPKGVVSEDRLVMHMASLKLKTTDDWDLITKHCNKSLTQEDLMLLLEDAAELFSKPTSGHILGLVSDFKVAGKTEIKSAKNLANGSISFEYVDETEVKGSATLPEDITLVMEPYHGVGAYNVQLKLRWRKSRDHGVVFVLKMMRPDKILRDAIKRTVEIVDQQCAIPTMYGQVH